MSDKGQFEKGHAIKPQFQEPPGLEKNLEPRAVHSEIPTEDGGYRKYRAAGKLLGRKALITGGDSGIGRATAILFAMEGADSFIVYLPQEQEDAEATKKAVEKHGRKCYLHATDLKDKDNCKKVVDEAIKNMGGVDILFNNAAYQMMVGDIKDLSEDQWDHTFQTNIHSMFYLCKYLMPHFESRSECTIINNASINAYVGHPELLDYTATKGAIVSFTRGLANQSISKGIRVNAVAPGPVWTPLITSTMTEEAQKNFSSPMGRPSQPSEVATCVVFLASTDSSSVTGQVIHCNGGAYTSS